MITRRQKLQSHDNNYAFNVAEILSKDNFVGTYPNVSVVIPYYETGEIFERCLHFLANAVEMYQGKVEVIVVDDGSLKRPLAKYENGPKWLECIVLASNQGRTAARNKGLAHSSGDIVLFMDSDILVDEQIIVNHVKLHNAALKNNMKAICVTFFEFTSLNDERIYSERIIKRDLKLNDFRIECTYGPTWIGCEEDKKYIGQHIKLVEETSGFKSWKGQHKAWMLPNMVLGGAFSVIRREILAVNGFDARFQGYGFTETSAVTRMVAERSNVVVPCLDGGALHIEDESVNVSREEKDQIFKIKHDFYFNTFLAETVR
jgi:glycosyltransferase involved in cell wall biosynthesis